MNEELEAKERVEIEYWLDSKTENPNADSLENIVNKLCEARIVLSKLDFFGDYFKTSPTILEIGAGQGWTSCMVKKLFPSSRVFASDISPFAIASAPKWEDIFRARLDKHFHCKSYEIPLDKESVDLVFCFQSAHHFVAHRETLAEVHRVLKRGGVCLYLHEPSCRRYLHGPARKRANRKRPEVPEDVLIYHEIVGFARGAGFDVELRFDPTLVNRAPIELVYYFALQKVPLLKFLLPCTIDYVFKKPAH